MRNIIKEKILNNVIQEEDRIKPNQVLYEKIKRKEGNISKNLVENKMEYSIPANIIEEFINEDKFNVRNAICEENINKF